MNKRTKGTAGDFRLNQHAPKYEHRATRRNRSRADKKRRAINESA